MMENYDIKDSQLAEGGRRHLLGPALIFRG